jgi:hypothetical protein
MFRNGGLLKLLNPVLKGNYNDDRQTVRTMGRILDG